MSDKPTIDIEKELRKSYLEYSLSVIIGRAIPDVRDGLKPVHRRIMFAQHELSNYYSRPPKKSARIVGDVIGKYHPHGDSAVYDALVRMAQDFSMRDTLVEGQGNFGSIDGDSAAAMRYTEVRMSKLAEEFLSDIEKETVEFRPNYDNTLEEPAVLPTKVPNLLLNGTSGIAVGMATNIAPHNLGELCDALLHLLDDPDSTAHDLMEYVKGPDFPTGGIVYAGKGLEDAFTTGRGSVKIRGKVEIEQHKRGESIVIREIPYGLNKSSLVEKIAFLVNERKIEGVSDLRDESDRKGIRIVIDVKRGAIPDIIINSLYKFTPLESSFAYNMLAVVNNRPQLLNLKSALSYFLEHRREVVIRRTRYDLRKSEARAHILEALRVALDHIDEVVAMIRQSKTPQEAKERLMARFEFTEIQAQAILDMRLQRLTNMEHEKLLDEYNELLKKIEYFKSILENDEVLKQVINEEITTLKNNFATPRKTVIELDASLKGIDIEDLIPDEDVVITLSKRGYIKRTTLDNYQQQKRGGKGIAGLHMSDDDMVQDFLTTSNHQYLLLFTNKGRMHQLKVHQVPEGSRTAKGAHIANLLPLDKEEYVTTALTVREFSPDEFFLFVTKKGMVKRSDASLYARSRKTGIIAVGLRDDDELITVRRVEDTSQVVLTTSNGLAIRFDCRDVRPMGRGASGVKGVALREGDYVVACVIVNPDEQVSIMTISRNGYGKRTKLELYRIQSRGGKGIINFKATPKTGPVIGAMPVSETDALLLLTSGNKIIRIGVDDVRNVGRATQGVRLVTLEAGASVVGFDRIDENGETLPDTEEKDK